MVVLSQASIAYTASDDLLPREWPLPPPPDSIDLSAFPCRTLSTGTRLFRAHAKQWGDNCWFFAHRDPTLPSGRFDGPDAEHGTCYTATNPVTALAEKLGFKGLMVLEREFLRTLWMSKVSTPRELRVADLTDRGALRFWACGRELSVLTPYETPQNWVRRWQQHGVEGVWYQPRHDPRDHVHSLAIFRPSPPFPPGPAPLEALRYFRYLQHAYGDAGRTQKAVVTPEEHPAPE